MSKTITIALCGNPNCGKTTLFNYLTGSRHQVGNWSGVTVEKKYGTLVKRDKSSNDQTVNIVDLPGTYSLDAVDESIAIDEKIARHFILSDEADLIVNIVDAANIERNLYLTTQLLETGKPMVVVLNMMDVAEKNGLSINVQKLSEYLNCPVIPVSAIQNRSLEKLNQLIELTSNRSNIPNFELNFEGRLSEFYEAMQALISNKRPNALKDNEPQSVKQVNTKWEALRLIEDANYAGPIAINEDIESLRMDIKQAYGDDVDIEIAEARYRVILKWIDACVSKAGEVSRTTSAKLDRIVLNKYLGIPIFLFVTYLMFLFTIVFGSVFVDFFDQSTNALLVEGPSIWLSDFGWPDWLITLFANGVGGGIQTVSTFIPIIGGLYLFLAVLEDSGYLARGAFVMDRFMQSIGLPGKSFIPLMVGLGCTVPAIYATRSLEYEKDRIMTVMMSPFISCGARLPVYILFAAAVFPDNAQNLIFALYLIGICIAILTGFMLKKTLLAGEASPFVMELPAYHRPILKNVLLKTWEKLQSFVLGAGKLIVLVVVVLSFFNSLGTDLSFGNENTEKSVLTNVGKSLTPAFEPMGLKQDNWPATVGLFTGLFAKEVVVGTINTLYISQLDVEKHEEKFVLSSKLAEAVETIPENFSAATDSWSDPLGINVDATDRNSIAEDQEINVGLFDLIRTSFGSSLAAFSYLLFVLLYSPCVSALGATFKETGLRWTLFSVVWTTFLAFSLSTIVYQAGTFFQSPMRATFWILGFLMLHMTNFFLLKKWALRQQTKALQKPVVVS